MNKTKYYFLSIFFALLYSINEVKANSFGNDLSNHFLDFYINQPVEVIVDSTVERIPVNMVIEKTLSKGEFIDSLNGYVWGSIKLEVDSFSTWNTFSCFNRLSKRNIFLLTKTNEGVIKSITVYMDSSISTVNFSKKGVIERCETIWLNKSSNSKDLSSIWFSDSGTIRVMEFKDGTTLRYNDEGQISNLNLCEYKFEFIEGLLHSVSRMKKTLISITPGVKEQIIFSTKDGKKLDLNFLIKQFNELPHFKENESSLLTIELKWEENKPMCAYSFDPFFFVLKNDCSEFPYD